MLSTRWVRNYRALKWKFETFMSLTRPRQHLISLGLFRLKMETSKFPHLDNFLPPLWGLPLKHDFFLREWLPPAPLFQSPTLSPRFNKSVLALKLASCNLNIDAIIKLLEGVNKNQILEALDISRASRVINPVNLSVHFQRYFANNNHTITTLVLNQLNLDDESIDNIVIGILRSENNLKNLNVASNKFSRDSSKSIVSLLSDNKNIEYLNLSYSAFRNFGLNASIWYFLESSE